MKTLPKLIVILGPTASGKTQWGIDLVKKINGEIISADSRQVYQKMTIGTAKPVGEWQMVNGENVYVVDGVPHHLMDYIDPKLSYTVAEWREAAVQKIDQIGGRGHLPVLVGGTGLYISTLIDNWQMPSFAPNEKLRTELEEKSHDELIALLATVDPASAETIDTKNPRRLIRALEVSLGTGKPFSEQRNKGSAVFDVLQIGIEVEREELYRRINERVEIMVKNGLIDEVKDLVAEGYDWSLPSMSGIGYRQWQAYLGGQATLEKTIEQLQQDTRNFAKRQLTWFRRDSRIVWCASYDQANERVQAFLQSDSSVV